MIDYISAGLAPIKARKGAPARRCSQEYPHDEFYRYECRGERHVSFLFPLFYFVLSQHEFYILVRDNAKYLAKFGEEMASER